MNLIIDQGNTSAKLALFEGRELVKVRQTVHWDESFVDELISGRKVDAAIFSSVARYDISLLDILRNKFPLFVDFNKDTRLPVTLGYRTPDTLGRDRIAGVVGAMEQYPQSDVLVIDAGTAITYDFLRSDGCFLGGNIAPGINLRFTALNQGTGRLPMVGPEGDLPLLGYDTPTAIRSGVVRGILLEIEGYIRDLQLKCPSLFVFLTGGDALLLAAKLKSPIFVDKNLVLKGLNRILYDNVEI